VLEGLFSQPAIERHNIPYVIAGVHEVSPVNEDISIRKTVNRVMEAVRIGDHYQSHQVVLLIFQFPDRKRPIRQAEQAIPLVLLALRA
jgi:hypothetical protein